MADVDRNGAGVVCEYKTVALERICIPNAMRGEREISRSGALLLNALEQLESKLFYVRVRQIVELAGMPIFRPDEAGALLGKSECLKA